MHQQHVCSHCEEVVSALTDAMGPIHDCVAVPAFANAPSDALIAASGTAIAATLSRAVFGAALAATSYVPTETPLAADVMATHPPPASQAAGGAPILCVTVAIGGTDGRSELFCTDESATDGEWCLRAAQAEEAPGFDTNSRTLCAVCAAPDRLIQVTAREVRMIDLGDPDAVCQCWAPVAKNGSPAVISAAYITPSHAGFGGPEHVVLLSPAEIMSLRIRPPGVAGQPVGRGPLDVAVAASSQLPHNVTGGTAFRMHDGSEGVVMGFWAESLAFAVLRADTLEVVVERAVEAEGSAGGVSGAAKAFATVATATCTRILVGSLDGQVSVYRVESVADGVGYIMHAECDLRVGQTHVRFAQLWDETEGRGDCGGIRRQGPECGDCNRRTAVGGVLAVAGRNATLLWCAEGDGIGDGCTDGAPAAATVAAGSSRQATTAAAEPPAPAAPRGLMSALVALPPGSDMASVCSMGGSGIVWAEAAGGVATGVLDRSEGMRKFSRPLCGAPQSLVHCPSVRAIACHVCHPPMHASHSPPLLYQTHGCNDLMCA